MCFAVLCGCTKPRINLRSLGQCPHYIAFAPPIHLPRPFLCPAHSGGLSSSFAFTLDANEALRAKDLHAKSMQRHDRQSCGAIRANEAINQSGACSSSDVITSGGRKSQTTMEDKLIVVVCGTRSCTILLRTFIETGINFAHLLCSKFHARMKRVNSK